MNGQDVETEQFIAETMEENQNKVSNVESIGNGTLRAKELVCSRKGYWRMAKVLNQIFSKKIIAKLGYTSMLDYYLLVVKTKEPPSTERYARWCGRTVNKIIIYLLPDCEKIFKNFTKLVWKLLRNCGRLNKN